MSSQALSLGPNLELRPISPFFWQGSLLKCEKWEAWAEQHWWGSCICMNEELTWAIIEQLEAGAAALTILAMLEACGVVTALGAVATAIVGLVVIAGALALIAADRGDGVCICLLHFPPGQILVMPALSRYCGNVRETTDVTPGVFSSGSESKLWYHAACNLRLRHYV